MEALDKSDESETERLEMYSEQVGGVRNGNIGNVGVESF